jgi:serine/threonine protein kinase
MTNSSSQHPPSHGQTLPTGTQLEEFVVERVLGSGGFGITYLAKDKRLGRLVVVKENLPVQFCWREQSSLTVRPRHEGGDDADNFRYTLDSFEREASTLASLDHPSIVKVLRSFEANGTAYFVMPFVEGTAFDEVIRDRRDRGQYFAEEELGGMLWRVLDALSYLHDRGIYHRDIKPGNILVTATGEPVLIDFGAARQRLSERSLTVIESAGYTPFEQLQTRGEIGPWSDIYSLAATFYKALTGETPAKAADRIMEDPVVPLASRPELQGRYSSRLLASIDQAMAPNAKNRFQTSEAWKACAWGAPAQATADPIHPPEQIQDDSVTMVRRPRRTGSDSPSTSPPAEVPAPPQVAQNSPPAEQVPSRPAKPTGAPPKPRQLKPKERSKLPAVLGIAAAMIGIASLAYFIQLSSKPPAGWNPSLADQDELDLYAGRGVMGAEVEQASRMLSDLEKKGYPAGDVSGFSPYFQRLLAASKEDHSSAALPLGKCYKNGVGVAKDEAEAVKWFSNAAETENVEAMRLLGDCYRSGAGGSMDSKKAIEWYEKAANADDYDLSSKVKDLTLTNFEIHNASLSNAVESIMAKSRDLDEREEDTSKKGIVIIIDDNNRSDRSTFDLYRGDFKVSDALRHLGDLYGLKTVIEPYAVLLVPASGQ